MRLKIATTSNETIFDKEIEQIILPSESGEVTLYGKSIPSIIKLVPWIIKVKEKWCPEEKYSISKGIALIDTANVRLTVSMLTERPLAKIVELRWTLQLLELKLQKTRKYGSLEEISSIIWEMEKIKADMELTEI